MTQQFLALTAYYNPFAGERRRRNFRTFRRRLGLPLVAVEWSPDGRFDLDDGDADVLVRVSGGDLLWQKERLLNIGLARIRERGFAGDVAILDGDIVFTDPQWWVKLARALDGHPVAQCFSSVVYLPAMGSDEPSDEDLAGVEPERSLPSVAHALSTGATLFSRGAEQAWGWSGSMLPTSGNPGMAFGVRLRGQDSFQLYEGNIVGGGDLVLSAACAGRLDELFVCRRYTAAHRADVLDWASRHVQVGAGLGCADNEVLHLWHGTLERRQYAQRALILERHDYDPSRDLDRGRPGALRLRPNAGAIGRAVAEYLHSRDDA